MVWGIGPSKAAADGYGPALMAVLDSEENQKHISDSRKEESPQAKTEKGLNVNVKVKDDEDRGKENSVN